ncbi:hypothetical protein T484DRAFT_1810925, partial [Baffinella frigidus]
VLFAEPPRFEIACGAASFPDCDVTMLAVPAPNRSGIAYATVKAVSPSGQAGPSQAFSVEILQVNNPPSFSAVRELAALESVEGGRVQTVAPAVFDILPGPYEDEAGQRGTLSFTLAPGYHGVASLSVVASDDGGTDRGGISVSPPLVITLKVFPLPRVTSVTPRLGGVMGGGRVTVAGAFFGSTYSRGFHAGSYSNLSVTIDNATCGNVTYISDAAVSCSVLPGNGAGTVKVEVKDGSLTRAGVLLRGKVHAEIYIAGVRTGAGGLGTIGFAPGATSSSQAGAPSLLDFAMSSVASKAVRAIAIDGPTAYMGGQFLTALSAVRAIAIDGPTAYMGGQFLTALGVRSNYVAAWDGRAASPLGTTTCIV